MYVRPFFVCFLFIFHYAYFILKKLSQKFGCLYFGQKAAGEATFASPVGPQLSINGVGLNKPQTTSLNPTSKHTIHFREPSKGGR